MSPSRRRSRSLGIATAALIATALPAQAGPEPAAEVPSPHDSMQKLGRGLAGVALGILEVPGGVVIETRENGPVSGFTAGLAKGVGAFVTRELVGLGQILTAPFAEPNGLETALRHAYPWDAMRRADGESIVFGPYVDFSDEAKELAWIRGVEIERNADELLVRFPSDLLFEVGQYALGLEAEPRLRGLAETLIRHPEVKVFVKGHTDSTGDADWNQTLSNLRAAAARAYLVRAGLEPDRIEIAGLGPDQPIAENDTLEGRRANRRVDFVLR